MTRRMYRGNRATGFTKVVSLVLAIVFTLSFTGVVHAMAPAEEVTTDSLIESTVLEEPMVPGYEAQEPAQEDVSEEGDPAPQALPEEEPQDAVIIDEPAADEDPVVESQQLNGFDPGGYSLYPGNPDLCPGGLKIDPPNNGTYYHMVGDVEVEITVLIEETEHGQVVSWTSSHGIDQVIVKGGPNAHLYAYNGALSGSGLHAPEVSSGMWADISWLGFCFADAGGGDPTPGTSAISVFKFCDADGDGEQGDGEQPLEGFTFELMFDGEVVDTAVTGPSGTVTFAPLAYGDYVVREVQRAGWEVTTGGYTQAVELGEDPVTVTFGNRWIGDEDTDWMKTFRLDVLGPLAMSVDDFFVSFSVDGEERYLSLLAAADDRYEVDVEVRDGAVIDYWVFKATVDGVQYALSPVMGPETITADTVNAYEFMPGTICGYKWLDADLDGAMPPDMEDVPGAGWTIVLQGPGISEALYDITGADGAYAFSGLLPGMYTVTEVDGPGYVQVHPVGAGSAELGAGAMTARVDFVNAVSLAGISIVKTADPAVARPGDTVTWTITVTNTGEVAFESTILNDPMLGIVELQIGEMAPGEVWSTTVQWVVPSDAPDEIVNDAYVAGYPAFGGPVVDCDSARVVIERPQVEKRFRLDTAAVLSPMPERIVADYTIDGVTETIDLIAQGGGVWISGPLSFDWGTTIDSWSIHAVVDGVRWPAALYAVTTPEVLAPQGESLVVVNQATFVPGSIVGSKAIDFNMDGLPDVVPDGALGGWEIVLGADVATVLTSASGAYSFTGLLPGTHTVAERMTAAQAALYTLAAPAEGAWTVVVSAGQNVVLGPFVNQPVPPSISIDKQANTLTAAPGDTITYAYTVTNTGPWALGSVVVDDDIIPGVSAVAIPNLAPAGAAGDSFTFTMDYVVPEDFDADTLTNVATVTAADMFGRTVSDTDTAVVEIEPFLPFTDVDVIKVADVDTVLPGGSITYTVTVTNVSESVVDSFTVVDDYPAALVTVTNAGGGVVADGTITWYVDEPLAAGDSVSFVYSVVVDDDVAAGTDIINVVTVPEFDVSDTAVVVVAAPVAPVTPVVPVTPVTEPFLPFTGGELLGLLGAAAVAAMLGFALRRFGHIGAQG